MQLYIISSVILGEVLEPESWRKTDGTLSWIIWGDILLFTKVCLVFEEKKQHGILLYVRATNNGKLLLTL